MKKLFLAIGLILITGLTSIVNSQTVFASETEFHLTYDYTYLDFSVDGESPPESFVSEGMMMQTDYEYDFTINLQNAVMALENVLNADIFSYYMLSFTLEWEEGVEYTDFYTDDVFDSSSYHLDPEHPETYYVVIPKSNLPFSYNFSLLVSSSTDAQPFKLSSITLDGFYVYDNSLDLGTDYSDIASHELPFHLMRGFAKELIDEPTNTWKIYVMGQMEYSFLVSIPTELFTAEEFASYPNWYMNATLSPTDPYDFLFLVHPDGADAPVIQTKLDGEILNYEGLMDDWITMNLSQGIWYKTTKTTLNAVVSKEANSNAYMYVSFPMDIDDIYSINVDYEYRLNTLFTTGSFVHETNLYQRGEDDTVSPPRWLWWLSLLTYNSVIPVGLLLDTNLYTIDQIAAAEDIPYDVSALFEDELGIDSSTLSADNTYKIHLGQFRSTWSVSYDITQIAIVDVIYEDTGVLYYVPYELLTQSTYTPEETGSTLDQLKDITSNIGESISDIFDGQADTSLSETLNLVVGSASIVIGLLIVLKTLSIIKNVATKKRYRS